MDQGHLGAVSVPKAHCVPLLLLVMALKTLSVMGMLGGVSLVLPDREGTAQQPASSSRRGVEWGYACSAGVVWVLGLVSWVLGPQGTTSPRRTPT